MKEKMRSCLNRIKGDRKKRRREMSLVLALSLMVTGGVSWQLRSTGTAMNDTGLENTRGHTPDEEFTEETLTGGEEAPPGSDLVMETPQQWEETLPDTLSGVWREDTNAVARSQLGYRESAAQFTAAEDGTEHFGYTRYGAWYGNPWGEWNTMFVYFCLHYAGIPEEIIPYGSGCWAWSLRLEEKGLLVKPGEVLPQQGDILLYDGDLDGKADRSGIVTEVTGENGTASIVTVEGNVNGEVAQCSRLADDEHIIGYVFLTNEEDEPETQPADEESGESEKEEENTSEDTVIEFSGSSETGIGVNVSAPPDAFPEDTVMKVSDISDEEARLTAAGMSGAEPGDIQAIAVDISFIAPDGTELEPDAQVQVNIVLPEEKKLTGEELSLLHVTDEGDVLEMTGADVTSDGASFETDSFSIYILTADNTYTEITQYYSDANKGDQHIYALAGESFTVKYDGYCGDDSQTKSLNPDIVQKGNIGYDYNVTMITYTALKPGTATLENTTNEPNHITVVVEQPMYVKTAINDRDIDRVNEWLPDVYINEKKNGYIPNVLTSNGHFHPYHINVGDTLTVYTPVLEGQDLSLAVQRLDLTCQPTGSWGDNSWYDKYTYNGTSDNDLLQAGTAAGPAGTVAASYTATQEGYAQILVVDGTNVIRTMYVQIGNPLGNILDHADIEIADGGKYTSSKIKREVDGTIRKTVTVYKSYVSDVNSCVLYSKTDPTQPCQFYRDPGQPYAESDNVTGYKQGDYWTDPRIAPGEPQYELTSKYKKNDAGQYIYWSPIKFYYDDVDHAVFDVQLELEPLHQLSYVKNGDDWVLEETTDLSSMPRTHIDSSIFYMGHQDVIDAFNKCPNHTGLDFTITAASALIELEVTKTMPGRTLQEGDFTFEVVEKIDEDNYKVISTASNDADGIVSFKGIHFEKAGEYTYYIREVNDGKFDNVVYSDETLEMKVNVHVDQQSGEIFAEIMDPEEMILEINNLRKYTLPETGGTGTVPYTIFGTAMIITASTLYLRKRRKLSASDSNE